MFEVGKVCVWEVENEVFSKFGCLGEDFYKGTHEAKLFEMQSGSVLSGLDAGNANTELKISSLPTWYAYWKCFEWFVCRKCE